MSVPEDVISRWLITDRLWPPTSADLNVWFLFVGILRDRTKGSYKLVTQKENLITPGIKAISSLDTFQRSHNIIKFSFS
jgi:hypothetical protein